MGYRVYIITASDSASEGRRADESGEVIRQIMQEHGYRVEGRSLLPDEKDQIRDEMVRITDEGKADLIVTTGGTGFSERDCMPEATQQACERMVPGIAEAMRMNAMSFTKRSMLSRAVSGIRKKTLIINLPGSPKAVRENLEYIVEELSHGLGILCGTEKECARRTGEEDGTRESNLHQ